MKLEIEEFLDHVDEWKFKLHERLKRMTAAERKAYWMRIHEEARRLGLPVVEPKKAAKCPAKRPRRTG